MSVTAAAGFVAGGNACGIKPSGAPDLALVATEDGRAVTAAGVFTTNLACAAPVEVSRTHLADGRAAAVVLNSGNANAATGEAGRRDARRMCELAGEGLGVATEDVLVCSTGLIGIPLPMEPIESGLPRLARDLWPGSEGATAAAEAILTTDTRRKESCSTFEVERNLQITVGGMAKGAAMLSPAMATMLAVVTTDAAVARGPLYLALERAVDDTFNQLSVDGCRSTNDTVVVLASGRVGGGEIGGGAALHLLTDALTEVCGDLAEQMARDAEGATKFVRVVVTGARSTAEARMAARAVAESPLVQCSLNGGDPYWGRVLSEVGASGAFVDPERVDIAYNGITVCRDGITYPHDVERVAAELAGRDVEIACELHYGAGSATVLTTDLSHGYIDENRRTS